MRPGRSELLNVARQDFKLLTVLHVEDDENDSILLSKACERAGLPVKLMRVVDGEEAREYLLRTGKFSDPFLSPEPQVVVLDLKLPRMSGFDFLIWLRGEERFAGLPVLIFTASLSRQDQTRALDQGATSYFVKPASFEALVQMVESFRILGSPDAN